MKKNDLLSFFLLALLWSTGLSLTSCSDDDEDAPRTNLVLDGTYSSFDSERPFALTYGGAEMPGKVAIVKTTSETEALITLQGGISLSQIPQTAQRGNQNLLLPGVIPGEKSTQLRVKLTSKGNRTYSFEGTDTRNGRTVRYSGEIRKDGLAMDLQVEMPQNFLSGTTWNLAEVIPSEEWGGANLQQPIYTAWEAGKKFTIDLGFPLELEPGALLVMALEAMPLFEDKNGNDLLLSLLQDVTFHADGNITAHYSEAADLAEPQWKQSPMNIAHYYVKDGKPYFLLNIGMLTSMQKKSGFTELLPLISDGIPLGIRSEEGKMTVYLETETLMPVLQSLMPILQKEETITAILEKLQNNEDFADFAPMAEAVLRQLPDVLKETTKLELGLQFTPAGQ